MVQWQRVAGRTPWPQVARGLSAFGEHSLGWVALGAVGAVVDRRHRTRWVDLGVAAFSAHASAVVLKRVVRRRRPSDPRIQVLTPTPSDLSFPSAHAASTTAAALSLVPLVGRPAAVATAASMGLARVLLGVHYPTDVVAGAALGLIAVRVGRRLRGREW